MKRGNSKNRTDLVIGSSALSLITNSPLTTDTDTILNMPLYDTRSDLSCQLNRKQICLMSGPIVPE